MLVEGIKVFRRYGLLAGVLAFSLGGGASAQSNERSLLAEGVAALPYVVNTQARLVFYWPKELTSRLVGTIWVDGGYHATLNSGGHSLLCHAPVPMRLGLRHLDAGGVARTEVGTSLQVHPQPGQTLYWRMSAPTDTALKFEPVAEAQALQELPQTREQSHTISRVRNAQACQDFGPRS